MGGDGGRDWAGKLPEVIKSNLVPGNNYDPSVRRSSQPQGLQGPPSSCTCAQGPREHWVNLARGTMVAEALKEARTQGVWFAVFSATLKGAQGKREVGVFGWHLSPWVTVVPRCSGGQPWFQEQASQSSLRRWQMQSEMVADD